MNIGGGQGTKHSRFAVALKSPVIQSPHRGTGLSRKTWGFYVHSDQIELGGVGFNTAILIGTWIKNLGLGKEKARSKPGQFRKQFAISRSFTRRVSPRLRGDRKLRNCNVHDTCSEHSPCRNRHPLQS